MSKTTARIKALCCSIFFLLTGVFSWFLFVYDWQLVIPAAIFYITLVVNTYFSIKLFSQIIPNGNKTQNMFDASLFCLYIATAINIADFVLFVYSALLLFIVATIKYVFLVGIIDYMPLLKRKILIDLLGAFACVLTLGGIYLGYEVYSAWIFAGVFAVANVFLIVIRPMYRL